MADKVRSHEIRHEYAVELCNLICGSGPLNGYAVYLNDTIRGTITCERFDTSFHDKTFAMMYRSSHGRVIKINTGNKIYKFFVHDAGLTFLFLQDANNNKISLIKLVCKEKEVFYKRYNINDFYRQIHSGKLSIYDHTYSFNSNYALRPFWENDDIVLLRSGSEPEFLRNQAVINCKKRIIDTINEIYNMHLSSRDYKPSELYELVSKLD
jgi:hypothetical protein